MSIPALVILVLLLLALAGGGVWLFHRLGNAWSLESEGVVETVQIAPPGPPADLEHAAGWPQAFSVAIRYQAGGLQFYNGTGARELQPGDHIRVYGNLLGQHYYERFDPAPAEV